MKVKTGIPRLLEIAGARRGLLIWSGVLSSAGAVLMLVPYASVYLILKELLTHAANPASADGGFMVKWGTIALLGLLGGLAMIYAGGMASHIAAFRILYGIRVSLSAHIGRLPLGWLNSTSTGAVKKTLDSNVEKVETFVAHQLPDLVHVIVTLALMMGVMFSLDARLALACVVPILCGLGMQALMMSRGHTRENIRRYHDSLERMNGSAVQYVRGMPAVKVFGQTVHSFRKFYADMIRYRDYCLKFTDDFQAGFLTLKVLLASFAAFVLPVGVFLFSRDPGSVAFASVLLFFLIMSPGIASPMFRMVFLSSLVQDINEGVERIDRIFAVRPIPEPQTPKRPDTFDIAFDDVSFSYDSDSAGESAAAAGEQTGGEALAHVSFVARQNQVTALVGHSGAGKSTVANLVPRFWDVKEGAIRIGNVDIREMRMADLMDTVAFVFQETFLFYDTVYNNILAGRPDATAEQVYAAAKAAQCHDFIGKLAGGYDTLIGEGGVYLSGGEEQRLAVARAILKNAPVLILDEATAFADPENEAEIQLALKELAKGKTVLLIAHRLSTVCDADQIIVLHEGRVAESGKHEQLVAAEGIYAGMWRIYADTANWRIGGRREALADESAAAGPGPLTDSKGGAGSW